MLLKSLVLKYYSIKWQKYITLEQFKTMSTKKAKNKE